MTTTDKGIELAPGEQVVIPAVPGALIDMRAFWFVGTGGTDRLDWVGGLNKAN